MPLLLVAGSGALLFGVGLAAGVWLYLIRLDDRPDAIAMTRGVASWNVLLFTVFALHHSIMARSRVKQWLMKVAPAALERSIYVWIASLLFIGLCLAWQPTRGVIWRAHPPFTWVLTLLQVLGLLVTALGARQLDVWELAGVRQVLAATRERSEAEATTARVATHESEPLDAITTRGPFGFVRHPIYFGWVLLVWSTPAMTSGRLLFAAISTLYLVIAIPLEERSLVHHFGQQYRDYQQQVRFRLIPGVW